MLRNIKKSSWITIILMLLNDYSSAFRTVQKNWVIQNIAFLPFTTAAYKMQQLEMPTALRATAKWLKSVLRLEHLPRQSFKADLSAFILLLNPHARQQNGVISAHTSSVTYFSSTATVVWLLSTEYHIWWLLSNPYQLTELCETGKHSKTKLMMNE